MIGLSLSFCVSDICRGIVKESDVVKIVTATKFATPDQLDEVIGHYQGVFWADYPAEAEALTRKLLEEGKIDQPRLRHLPTCTGIGSSRWMTEECVRLCYEDGEFVPYADFNSMMIADDGSFIMNDPQKEKDRTDFEAYEAEHGSGCSCYSCPPCSWCTHPGNPHNQEG